MGKSKTPSQIFNLILDIITLARAIRNIKFMYSNRSANRLAVKITKKPIYVLLKPMYCKNVSFILFYIYIL